MMSKSSHGSSSPALSERSLHQTLLTIRFIIIGAGASGLCAAIALSRIGHKVTLIEAQSSIDETPLSAGSILPPNTIRLVSRWGLDQQLHKMSRYAPGFKIMRFSTGEHFGDHMWDEEFFKETGAEMRTVNYSAFRKLLKDKAAENGTEFRFGTRVKAVDTRPHTQPVVTLESGEQLKADVVIGADGLNSLVRKMIVDQDERTTYMGTDVFNVLIPGDKIAADPVAKGILDEELMRCTLGNKRANFAYSVPPPPGSLQQHNDYTLNLFLPGDGLQERWASVDRSVLLEKMGDCDPVLRRLVELSSMISAAAMVERPLLDNWVHPDGRVLVIGDAAHIFYPCAIQNLGVAVCDAATLGAFFQHIHHHQQIGIFLNAFQEIRPERIQFMRSQEFGNLGYMMMPDGPEQEERDNKLRRRREKNLNALDDDGTEMEALAGANMTARWESLLTVFGYDAEEEADKWWAQWGALQERAAFSTINPGLVVEIEHEQQTEVITVTEDP